MQQTDALDARDWKIHKKKKNLIDLLKPKLTVVCFDKTKKYEINNPISLNVSNAGKAV